MNEELEYSIKEDINGTQQQTLFVIDSITGEIRVNNSLVIEEGESREIIVTVKDKGDPSLDNFTSIWITVIEGRIVSIDVRQNGFLTSEQTRNDDTYLYSQSVQFLTSSDYGSDVIVSGRVGTAFSRSFENQEIPVSGGKASSLRGTILQEKIYYNPRTVSVLVQPFDIRDGIAGPTLIRVMVTPSTVLATLIDTVSIGYCVTSDSDGYCVAKVILPDQWFQRSSFNQLTDTVAITIQTANDEAISVELGNIPVEASPVYEEGFLSDDILTIVAPSEGTVYTGNSFTVEVYLRSPSALTNGYLYDRITTSLPVGADFLDGFDFDDHWNCGKSCDIHVRDIHVIYTCDIRTCYQ